jgi:hypothetical protein
MNFIETLLWLAKRWEEETGRARSRLASIVVNDGKMFDRIERGSNVTVATFETCLEKFREEATWYGKPVPSDVADRLAQFAALKASAVL